MAALAPLLMLATLVVLGVAAGLVASFANRMRFSVPGAQGADARELRTYVHAFSRTLSTLGVSRSARRRHVDELKANLAESVAADGIRAALAGLGPAGALATGYADYRPRPAWVVGGAAAVLAWLVALFVHFEYAHAYASGLTDATGLTGASVVGNITNVDGWGVTFEAVLREGLGPVVHVSSPWVWILPLAAFFLASRSWRVLSLRNAASVSV